MTVICMHVTVLHVYSVRLTPKFCAFIYQFFDVFGKSSLARKSDVWLAVDPLTGTKLHSFNSDGIVSSTCPVPDSEGRALYIARTSKHVC